MADKGNNHMIDIDRRAAVGLIAAAALPFGPAPARAADYPTRTIKMIVPYPAGGPTDIMGRVVADFMARDLKQSVVVDNRPGANGSVGADATAKADPDGYTMLMTAGSVLVQNPLVYKRLTYDPTRDFRMLSILTDVPVVMVVHPSVPVKTVKEFVDYAKANPGKINFGSAGVGGTLHLAGERFKYTTGIEMTHVPYKGTAPALSDLLSAQIQVIFDTLSTSIPHIQSGGLRALAMATPERLSVLPDVPTVAESGYPDFVVNVWFGVAAPIKVPDDVALLAAASMQRAMADATVRNKLEKIGYVVQPPRDPAAVKAFFDADRAAWAKVVTAQKISID